MKLRLGRGALIAAAGVVASLFVLLCMLFYGSEDYLSPEGILERSDALRFRIAAAFVEPFGAGAFLGLGLVFVWSVIAWFRETIGAVVPRLVGLAAVVPSFCAMTSLGSDPHEFWAGSVGLWMGDILHAGFGPILAWFVTGTLFLVSLALATEFGFVGHLGAIRESFTLPLLPPEAAERADESAVAVLDLEPDPAETLFSSEDLDLSALDAVPGDAADVKLLDRDAHIADIRARVHAGETVTDEELDLLDRETASAETRDELAEAIDAVYADLVVQPETTDEDAAPATPEVDEDAPDIDAALDAADAAVADVDAAALEDAAEEDELDALVAEPPADEEALAWFDEAMAGEDAALDLEVEEEAGADLDRDIEAQADVLEIGQGTQLDEGVSETHAATRHDADGGVDDGPSFPIDPAAAHPLLGQQIEDVAIPVEPIDAGDDQDADTPDLAAHVEALNALLDQPAETPAIPPHVDTKKARVIDADDLRLAMTETEEMDEEMEQALRSALSSGPSSFSGVEFLPPNEELAELAPLENAVDPHALIGSKVDDDAPVATGTAAVEDAPEETAGDWDFEDEFFTIDDGVDVLPGTQEVDLEAARAEAAAAEAALAEESAVEESADTAERIDDDGPAATEAEEAEDTAADAGAEVEVEAPEALSDVEGPEVLSDVEGSIVIPEILPAFLDEVYATDGSGAVVEDAVEEPFDGAQGKPVEEAAEDPLAALFGDPVEPREEAAVPSGPAQTEPREAPVAETVDDDTNLDHPVSGDATDRGGVRLAENASMAEPDGIALADEELIVPATVVDDVEVVDDEPVEEAPSLSAEAAAEAILDSLPEIFGGAGPETQEALQEAEEAASMLAEKYGWDDSEPSIEDEETAVEETEASVTPTPAPVVEPSDATEVAAAPAPVEAVDEEIEQDDAAPVIDEARVDALVGLFDDIEEEDEVQEEEAAPETTAAAMPSVDGRDELFDEAVAAVRDRGRGSVIVLQRKLGIGFTRASKLLDQLQEAGIVGPENASGSHPVL